MRGVAPVPVMSPMSKSFRKRERSASRSNTTTNKSPPKKAKLTEADSPDVKKSSPVTNPSSALSGASTLSVSKNGAISSPSTPDRANGQRSLRPRQTSDSAVKRSRRPFHDVNLSEDDATKVLGRRIKVWWPLDKKWYTGDIRNYDDERRCHLIVYDDHEEEWLHLENETFKIQLQLGDSFPKAPPNTKSSYTLRNRGGGAAAACSGQDENPSVSGDTSHVSHNTTVQRVYTRRRNLKNPSKSSGSLPVPSAASNIDAAAGASDTVEVQSPIRMESSLGELPLEDPGIGGSEAVVGSPERAVSTCLAPPTMLGAVLEEERNSESECSVSRVDLTGRAGIERWPLSRNVSELLRFIEIRSGGRRGSLAGGRVLNQVWRGLLPVWNIGDLFSLNLGSSTELVASGETVPSIMKSAKIRMGSNRSSLCMLISWNGFTLEKNARLKEVLEASLRQFQREQQRVSWKNSLQAVKTLGSYLSVTLLCVPSSGRQLLLDSSADFVQAEPSGSRSDRYVSSLECLPCSAASTELVCSTPVDGSSNLSGEVQETCSNTKPICAQTRLAPSASRCIIVEAGDDWPVAPFHFNNGLRQFFSSKWEDLNGGGLHLSFDQSCAVFASRCQATLLRIHRMNTSLERLPSSPSHLKADSATVKVWSPRPLQGFSRTNKKGRRTLMKRPAVDEATSPSKRVKIASNVDETNADEGKQNVLNGRSPSKKVWNVVPSSYMNFEDTGVPDLADDKKRSPETSIEDDDFCDDEHDVFEDDLDGSVSGKRKRRRGAFGGYELKFHASRNFVKEILPCTANLLIVQADRGWREVGVTVELQKNALVVSLNGEVLYTHEPKQQMQPGLPNKYSHAVMWRGGPDWMLEFHDRLQWHAFRRMHLVCVRRQPVKQLPVPYFHELPSSEQHVVSFQRPRDYIRQVSGEREEALLTSKVLYDVDSDDELWLHDFNRHKASDTKLSEDLYERVIHHLERAAFRQKQEVSVDAAVEVCASFASPETVKLIHARWLDRRRRKGMALIRCFQPTPCEQYETLLRAWEPKQHICEKPKPFAFALRPPNGATTKVQRQRPQRKAAFLSRQQWNAASPPDDSLTDLEEPYGHRADSSFMPDPGSPASDVLDDSHRAGSSKQKSNRGRKPSRKLRKMKSISISVSEDPSLSRRAMRPYIAPATPMKVDTAIVDVEQVEGESCSSMELDLDEDAVLKAQLARKAAKIAAEKAARAQQLYAQADAAMKRAVACLIEAEALAAAEKAAREASGPEGDEMFKQDEEDDDLLLPVSNWTHEFGSGLIQPKGEATSSVTRRGLNFINVSIAPADSLASFLNNKTLTQQPNFSKFGE